MEGVGRKKPLQLLQREPQACVEHYWHQQSKSVFWEIKIAEELDQYPYSTKLFALKKLRHNAFQSKHKLLPAAIYSYNWLLKSTFRSNSDHLNSNPVYEL